LPFIQRHNFVSSQGGWGKRAWDKLQGSWGKRDALSALLSQELASESSQDFLNDDNLRAEDVLAASESGPLVLSSSSSNSPSLGSYGTHLSDAENSEPEDQETVKRALADWSNFRG